MQKRREFSRSWQRASEREPRKSRSQLYTPIVPALTLT